MRLLIGLLAILVTVVIYFLPTIVAYERKYKNRMSVLIVDLFLGWTLIGWVIALALSFINDIDEDEKPSDKTVKTVAKIGIILLLVLCLLGDIINNKILRTASRYTNNLDVTEDVTNQEAMIKEDTPVKNIEIEGSNSQGSYFSNLTISETDAIASLLRQNWNLDPGAMGNRGMIVEIRVSFERDGSINEIEFVDKARYNSDPNYRSVAESTRRAVIMTGNAFKQVFGQKYANRYDVWSTLLFYFDPLDKSVK